MQLNLEPNSPLHSFLLIVMILIILYLIYKIIKKPSNNIPTTSGLTQDKIDAALTGAGIITIDASTTSSSVGTENFTTDIVYDSIDKIIDNLESYINTYYPSLDINEMNRLITQYSGVNKTISQFISENRNINNSDYIFSLLGQMSAIIFFTSNNETYMVLSGIGFVNIINLNKRIGDYKAIYLDDYDVKKDFIIYFVPQDYDISTLANNASSIPETYNFSTSWSEPNKISINNLLKLQLKEMFYSVNTAQYSEQSMVTDNDAINLLNIFKSNSISFLKYARLSLIAPFVYNITRTPFTRETGLGKDLYDLFTDGTSFSSSIRPYLPSIEDTMTNLRNSEQLF